MATFDITKFLDQLPRVPPNEMNQDEDSICPICHVEYLDEDPDTGYAEHPVRLPCGHNVGKHCILQWLKPKPYGCHANSCVICRYQFFEPWPVTPQAPQERNMNTDELATHIRAVEGAGYMIGHYLGSHAPRSRSRVYQQMLANRREVAVKEKALYEALRLRNVALPSGNGEMLNRRQDQCLFEYIERAGGFRGVRLNEQYRRGFADLVNGRSLTNAEIWGHLRDQYIWWDIGNEWHGRWRTREGWLYPDEDEDDADIFEELQLGGAFSTPGIDRHFRSQEYVSDWTIYRRTREMMVRWHPRLGVWRLGDENQFGDMERLSTPWADRPGTLPSGATEAQLEARRQSQRAAQLALDERHRRAVVAIQGGRGIQMSIGEDDQAVLDNLFRGERLGFGSG